MNGLLLSKVIHRGRGPFRLLELLIGVSTGSWGLAATLPRLLPLFSGYKRKVTLFVFWGGLIVLVSTVKRTTKGLKKRLGYSSVDQSRTFSS